MIRESTYLNALTTARGLADNGRYLQARKGSLLNDLVEASASSFTVQTTNLPAVLSNARLSSQTLILDEVERAMTVVSNTSDYEEASLHSKKLNSLVDGIAPYITSHISAARNTVAPKVVKLSEKLMKFAQDAKPLDPSSQFEIQQRAIPAILLDEGFLADNLEKYDGVEAKYPYQDLRINFEKIDETYYRELINLGSDRLNGLARDWLAGLPKDFVRHVFSQALGLNYLSSSGSTDGLIYSPSATKNVYEDIDLHLGLYLVATRVFNAPPPAQGVTLDNFQVMVRQYITYAGSRLLKLLKTAARQLEAKIMVVETVSSQKRVVVSKPIYQAWLQEGGAPEILLGMVVSGKTSFSISAANEQKDALIRAWQNYVMLNQAEVRSELKTRFIHFLEAEVLADLDELTELEKSYYESTHAVKELVLGRVRKEVESFHHRLMDDIPHLALHVIAKGRFFFTSAYDILNEMNLVARENPGIDPREAALLSTIEYFSNFIVDQIDQVK